MLYCILAISVIPILLISVMLLIRYGYFVLKNGVLAENIQIHKERLKCILISIILFWISIICCSVLVGIELNVFDVILPCILAVMEIILLECKKKELF